jgi:hypothetical protein
MQFVLDLTEENRKRLEERARPLGLTAEALAKAAIVDLLDRPAEDYTRAVERVLAKNEALYKRLA